MEKSDWQDYKGVERVRSEPKNYMGGRSDTSQRIRRGRTEMKDSKHHMEAKKEKYDSIVFKCGKIFEKKKKP